jgi:hypothetical protein
MIINLSVPYLFKNLVLKPFLCFNLKMKLFLFLFEIIFLNLFLPKVNSIGKKILLQVT